MKFCLSRVRKVSWIFFSISANYKGELLAKPGIVDIQTKWDQLMAKDPSRAGDVDLCGTLLPNAPDIHAGPNARRCILHPREHWNKYHKTEDAKSTNFTLGTIQKVRTL